ncbi:polysaccharide biosynthesis C-terminal domain-containing protein [Bacillus sp. JCM 19034]|uniref:polysaccharide biosynthesis C-terminal domain-containing protein n=1 Tax=Bacillus sp. JCM 19034 TaxID=1481928 RepID=UPI000AF09EDF
MGRIALANFIRRAAQLLLLIMLFLWSSYHLEFALVIAFITLIASEAIVFLYLFVAFMRQMRLLKQKPRAEVGWKKVRQGLLSVSIPTTGLRIFHSATFAIKPFFIKSALVRSGMVESVAMVQYGKLAGVAFSIGFFPAFIAHSLLIVLIPTVSEAFHKADLQKLRSLLQKVMFITAIYGIVAVCIFYFYADTLTSLFFKDSPAVRYLQLLLPYFLFHYFVIPMQAYLIGLGLVKEAFLHALYTTIVSFILMYVLGSMSAFQMDGIIIGMNISAVLLTMMHYVTICERIRVTWWLRAK